MNLPDAPIPHEGFFGTHCFAVIDTTNRRPLCPESWWETDPARRFSRRTADPHSGHVRIDRRADCGPSMI